MLRTSAKLTPLGKELLRNPRILLCAWNKVTDWYRNEIHPEPEYSNWSHNPRALLAELAEELISGRYSPSDFPLIPYPKKGGKIRHYAQPSVKDQVAFALLGVILGPLFEARFSNSSYGNRWFRGIELKSSSDNLPQWKANPFFLSDRNLNLPFARSYGLFRRIAHWRARKMLRDEKNPDSTSNRLKETDFDPTLLAYSGVNFTSSKSTVYYSRLDLSKAYPSVNRDHLITVAKDLILKPGDKQFVAGAFYKGSIWQRLESEKGRNTAGALTNLWMEMLSQVTYIPGPIGTSWHEGSPTEFPERYQEKRFGIPTGLAVSGLFFNIYLNEFDHAIKRNLAVKPNLYSGIALRFVDDLIIIGTTKQSLEDSLCFTEHYFGTTGERPHLAIGWEKARPESLGGLIKTDGARRTLKEILAGSGSEQFWIDATITAADLKEFVTDLVEELSELGSESLDDLMGDHGDSRLKQLHDLINIERHDSEVKNDTRLAFAASRLSRHPIPFWLDSGEQGQESLLPNELQHVRQSISRALTEAPWKFRIWQAAIAAAMRTEPRSSNKPAGTSLDRSTKWLERILRNIALNGGWERNFPGSPVDGENQLRRNQLATSFLRTYFWRALAKTIKSFSFAHPQGQHHPHISEKWRPNHWAWYVIPEESHRDVYDALADISKWTTVLYGQKKPQLFSWEHDALIEATLATSTWQEVFQDGLAFTESNDSHIDGILKRLPKKVASAINRQSPILTTINSLLGLSQSIGQLEEAALCSFVSRTEPKSRIDLVLGLGKAGALNYLSEDAFTIISKHIAKCALTLPRLWLPFYYHDLRALSLSNGAIPSILIGIAKSLFPTWEYDETHFDVHWLLWSNSADKRPEPEVTPSMGLPPGIVQLMLRDGLATRAEACFTWGLNIPAMPILCWGRSSQLDSLNKKSPPMIESTDLISSSKRTSMPPHASFLIRNSPMWANGLLALTSLTGNERILDSLWDIGPEPVSISERLSWRSQALAPRAYWNLLDRLLSGAPSDAVETELLKYINERLLVPGWKKTPTEQVGDLFSGIFADINLKSGDFFESPQSSHARTAVPKSDTGSLDESLIVRIAQLREIPDWQSETAVHTFPSLPQRRCLKLISNFLETLPDYNGIGGKANKPQLLMGPEVFLPYDSSLIRLLRNAAKKRNLAILIGLYWHEVPFAVTPNRKRDGVTRYFANEALLLVPITHPGNSAPYVVREFRIPKPLPAATEYGLAKALTQQCSSWKTRTKEWRLLCGTRWYCFKHPHWGYFTVAICSDLLDPIPWALMRQRLQHLFVISCNIDIDLYQSITWSRAYECYVNLVAVNHGYFGGSFSWTPKHKHQKEIVVLRGSKLNVVVDLLLSVKSLVAQQLVGWEQSVAKSSVDWLSPHKEEKVHWKTPPHNFKLLE